MYVIGDSCRGYEFEAAKTAGVFGVRNGVEDDVYRMEVESYDGPNFRRIFLP